MLYKPDAKCLQYGLLSVGWSVQKWLPDAGEGSRQGGGTWSMAASDDRQAWQEESASLKQSAYGVPALCYAVYKHQF